jgi:putative DNA primase/helicase
MSKKQFVDAPEETTKVENENLDFDKDISTSPDIIRLKNLDPVGARDRVLDKHHQRMRFLTDRQKLLVHDGRRYGNFPHLAEGMALEVLEKVHLEYQEGMLHLDEHGQQVEMKPLLLFQAKVRTLGMLQQVLKLARLDSRIQATSKEFDSNPYEINLENGLLDLQSLTLTPHNPSQLVTKLAPVSWESDAQCAFWESFIDEITCGDKELAAYLQRLCGYCLSGSTQEEVLPILYGVGANGKSLYLGTMRDLLGSGEYSHTLSPDSILNSRSYGIPYEHRQLEGKRVALAIEVNRGSTLNEATVKSLTGGDETSGRAIGENPVQFKPQATIIMAVNHLPGLVGSDRGLRRRLQVVPFKANFDGKTRKEEIERQIMAEKEGVFAWMVRGFQAWLEKGLNPPAIVLKATEEYFQVNDHIGSYLAERTAADANAKTPVKHLYEDYVAWARDSGLKPLGKHQLGDLLRSRGVEQDRSGSARFWKGLVLNLAG